MGYEIMFTIIQKSIYKIFNQTMSFHEKNFMSTYCNFVLITCSTIWSFLTQFLYKNKDMQFFFFIITHAKKKYNSANDIFF